MQKGEGAKMNDFTEQWDQPTGENEAGGPAPSTSRAGLRYGFTLARSSARMVIRRPGLTLAVLLLASLTLLSNAAVYETHVRLYEPGALRREQQPMPPRGTLVERWARWYQQRYVVVVDSVLWRPLRRYVAPLGRTTSVLEGWVSWAARAAKPVLKNRWHRTSPWFLLAMLGFGTATAVGSTLFLVGVLGWLRDRDRRVSISAWPRYWRAHYAPVVAVVLMLAVWQALRYIPRSHWSALVGVFDSFGRVGIVVGAALIEAVLVAPLVALMLAPFVMVARGLGVRAGIVESLRLLRRYWPALIVLFLIFRLGYELLTIWWLLLWPRFIQPLLITITRPTSALLWLWAHYAAIALLGLWLAHAFMEIARRPADSTAHTS